MEICEDFIGYFQKKPTLSHPLAMKMLNLSFKWFLVVPKDPEGERRAYAILGS